MTDVGLNCYGCVTKPATIELSWIMVNWVVRNRTVWSFNILYLQNVFRNHIFNIYLKKGFSEE